MTEVEGIAMPTKITVAATVQAISTQKWSSNFAAIAPEDFLYFHKDQNIIPKTTTPIHTQIHIINMCKSKISSLTSVTPTRML